MAKFEVFGKKVFVDDELVKAFEKLQGIEFDNNTAEYLVVTGEGDENASPLEITRLIEEGIAEHFQVYKKLETLMPEMERMAMESEV